MEKLQAFLPYGQAVTWIGERLKWVATTIGITAGTVFAIKLLRGWWYRLELTHRRQEKQKARQNTLEALAQHLNEIKVSHEEKDKICNLSLEELYQQLQDGKLKSVDVLHAYQKKALEANEITNAIIDVVREAESVALECDQMQNKNGRLLHGVPVSIKDNFPMAGYDSIIGLSCNINKPYAEGCVLVKVLKHQGAVPFVRTNVPQTMMSYDTCNPVFGQTYNPHGVGRNAGGSSGGESALIGGGGSLLGLAADIGGSIRIPSSMCGVCGFKPTSGRGSTRGTNPAIKGQNVIMPAYGPMARDVDSLIRMMRAILCQYHFDLDKTIPPLPFNEETFKRTTKLRIGYYLDDGFITPAPPMQRAVKEAIAGLQQQGHEVVQWKFAHLGRVGVHYWIKVIFASGGKELLDLLKGDAIDHAFGALKQTLSMNTILFNLITFVIKILYPRVAVTLPHVRGVKSVSNWQQVVCGIDDFRTAVESDLKEKKIDILIAPAFAMPAPPVGAHQYCSGAASYTAIFNVLNFPAGTIPVTKVNAADTAEMVNYPTPDIWHKTIKTSMVGAEGLPVGVQVVSLPWEDETCLRIMKELETALKQ